MKQQIRISDIVAQPHLEYFNSNKLHQLDHGGRAGYKSSKNALKIALKMLQDPTCEVMVIRQDYTDHRDSTFRDLLIAFKRLGVKLVETKHYPAGETSALYIRLPQGNYVHFKQMKSIDKVKGTRPHNDNNDIKIIWYFEITEYKSSWFIDESNATHVRGGNKDYMWCLYEWNDAPKLSHWTYDWVKMMEQDPDAYVKKTNYNDAPKWQQVKFLGNIYLKMIDTLFKLNPEQAKSTYYGLPANLAGTVYKGFSRERNVKPATHEYIDIIVGVDIGANDATVFTARGIKPNYKGTETFTTYYHKNGKTGGIKGLQDYLDDLLVFCEEIYARHKIAITVYADNNNLFFYRSLVDASYSEQYSYIVVEKLPKMKKLKSSKKTKSVLQERADMNNLMYAAGYKTIDPSCVELIKAVEEREYDQKGNPADNGTSDVDSIDSDDYTWLMDMDFIYDTIIME